VLDGMIVGSLSNSHIPDQFKTHKKFFKTPKPEQSKLKKVGLFR